MGCRFETGTNLNFPLTIFINAFFCITFYIFQNRGCNQCLYHFHHCNYGKISLTMHLKVILIETFLIDSDRQADRYTCIKKRKWCLIVVLKIVKDNAFFIRSVLVIYHILGMHFNITEGIPIGSNVRTLTDDKGCFLGRLGFLNALSDGKIDFMEASN